MPTRCPWGKFAEYVTCHLFHMESTWKTQIPHQMPSDFPQCEKALRVCIASFQGAYKHLCGTAFLCASVYHPIIPTRHRGVIRCVTYKTERYQEKKAEKCQCLLCAYCVTGWPVFWHLQPLCSMAGVQIYQEIEHLFNQFCVFVDSFFLDAFQKLQDMHKKFLKYIINLVHVMYSIISAHFA